MAGSGHGVTEAARRSGLLMPDRPVVVMLSGGPDSTCLLDVAVELVGRELVSALHIDHGLRPGSVDADVCASTCSTLDVNLRVCSLDPESSVGNLQAWARESRYRLAEEAASESGGVIAVGHTASDQAETILYRLAAAPGRRALLGMRASTGNIIRPLLGVDRAMTLGYCQTRGFTTVDDPSNTTDRFARGRVRNGLVPALREIHPAAEANINATAEILRDEAEVLDSIVTGLIDGTPPVQTIPLERLRAQPPALRRLIVQRMADDSVGRLAPGVARRADEVAAMADQGTVMLDLPSAVRAIATRGVLRFAQHNHLHS